MSFAATSRAVVSPCPPGPVVTITRTGLRRIGLRIGMPRGEPRSQRAARQLQNLPAHDRHGATSWRGTLRLNPGTGFA